MRTHVDQRDPWAGLVVRREAERRSGERAIERAREAARPGKETKRLLHLAVYGLPDKPVGCWDTDRITIDNRIWAGLIWELAGAWVSCPGSAALKKRPLPDEGYGVEAGERIFAMACDGASKTSLAKHLGEARRALGRAPAGDLVPVQDYDFGIWVFFTQLWRYFDGKKWKPPTHPDHRRSKLSNADSKALDLLEKNSPKFTTEEALCSAANWSGNGRTLVRRLRRAGYAIESARAARKTTDSTVPKGAKGYRLKR